MQDDAAERALAEFRHEAANPLALMVSAFREIARRSDDDDVHDLVEVGLRQSDVLERLLERLRGTGDENAELVAERLDLNELASNVVRDLEVGLLADRACEVRLGPDPTPVDGDPVLLRQALTNLLDNAVKYSPASSDIHVVVERDDTHALLWVQDEGEGVAPEDMEAIFDRFQRRSDRPGGLGIGLAVVARVAEAHDGLVEAVPAPCGTGTRFVVSLPLADGA